LTRSMTSLQPLAALSCLWTCLPKIGSKAILPSPQEDRVRPLLALELRISAPAGA
jgi:hypothetical protein